MQVNASILSLTSGHRDGVASFGYRQYEVRARYDWQVLTRGILPTRARWRWHPSGPALP